MKLTKEEIAMASDAWESLLRSYVLLNRQFAQEDIWAGISMREYDILYTLAKSGCALSQSELLSAVSLSQPAVSRMLSRMEDKGLIERTASPDDARSSHIKMTETGWEVQRAVGRAHGKQVAHALTSRLDSDEVVQLKLLCDKILKGVAGQ